MPPKCRFTREEIIKTALDLTREEGINALTARALGAKLGSSPKPIFTVFENMEEVLSEVRKAAKVLYAEYIRAGLSQELAFKGVGTQYIMFAIQEPKLFQLLFMEEQPQKPSIEGVLPVIDENYPQILASVQNGYGLDKGSAETLYRHLWIYSHGIAVLCATNLCTFSPEEIGKMVTEAFNGLLSEIRGGNRT